MERHGADPVDRPRLPARGARLVGKNLSRTTPRSRNIRSSSIIEFADQAVSAGSRDANDGLDADVHGALRARASAEVRGQSVVPLIRRDEPQRDIGILDVRRGRSAPRGRYTYYLFRTICMRRPAEYHADAEHLHTLFSAARCARPPRPPFDFTKGCRSAHRCAQGCAAHPHARNKQFDRVGTTLYDLGTMRSRHARFAKPRSSPLPIGIAQV